MTMYNALSVDIVQAVDESFDLKLFSTYHG